MTQALVGCLTERYLDVSSAAMTALAERQDPGVTQALLGRLSDQDRGVQSAAAIALAGRDDPETLLLLARKVRTLSQPSLLRATQAAEPLMIRHYRHIDPTDQPEVLAAMGWLTTAALSDRSA